MIFAYPKKEVPLLVSSFFFSFYFIDQSKTANDRESHFGLGYQKLSMESKGDHPGIGTFSLIYWNHFLKPGLILFHMYSMLAHTMGKMGPGPGPGSRAQGGPALAKGVVENQRKRGKEKEKSKKEKRTEEREER